SRITTQSTTTPESPHEPFGPRGGGSSGNLLPLDFDMSPSEYTIPQSRAFSSARDLVKPVLRKLGPWYTYFADKWYWTKIFANYVAIKWGFKTGIWSQTIYVEVTNVCNAKCVFCAYPDMERSKTVMTMEHFRSVITQWVEIGGDEADL